MRLSLPRKNINIVKVIDLVDQGIKARKPKSHYEIVFTDKEKAEAFLKYCAQRYLDMRKDK